MRINSSLRRHSIPRYRGVERGLGNVGDAANPYGLSPDIANSIAANVAALGIPAFINPFSSGAASPFDAAIARNTITRPTLSDAGIAPYVGLPTTLYAPNVAPQIKQPPGPILNPHTTTALSWLTGGPILNIGAPRSIYDPDEYLRSAVMDSDWKRVAGWYAYYISQLWQNVSHAKSAYWALSQMNICEYKYVVNSAGQKRFYPLSYDDVAQFARECIFNFRVNDTGRETAQFGVFDSQGKKITTPAGYYLIGDGGDDVAGGMNQPSLYNALKAPNVNGAASAQGSLSLGWVRGPEGPWSFGNILALVSFAVAGYGAAAGISAAIAGAAAPSVGAVTTAGASAGDVATAGTIAATSAPALIAPAASTALEEVIITASLAPAISTAGAIAGTVAAAGAAGVIAATASAPAVSTPALQEIVVTASPAAPVSTVGVAAGVAGAVVPIATAPAIVAAGAETPPLQEIVVTGTPNAPAPISLPTATVSLVDAGISAALANPSLDIQSPNLPELNNPDAGSASWWERLLQTYGSNYIRSHLNDIMCRLTGHCPSQAQLDAQDQYLQTLPGGAANGIFGSSNLLWIVAAAVIGLAVVLPEKKQKTHRRAKHRLLGVRRK